MTGDILANWVGVSGAVVVMVVYVFIIALIIICLVRVSRYCRDAGKERKLVRIELGKLAEEVHIIRQKLESRNEQKTSAQ